MEQSIYLMVTAHLVKLKQLLKMEYHTLFSDIRENTETNSCCDLTMVIYFCMKAMY